IADTAEIEVQHVHFHQAELRAPGKARAQARGQVAVDLDGEHAGTTVQQRAGECALPGADFDQCFTCLRVRGRYDAFNDVRIVQKVLPEALACAMALVLAQARLPAWWARLAAMATAARRLPASALPLPARSSAVPWSTEVRMKGSPS